MSRSACETACFCLRSMIIHTAGDAGMAGLDSVCGPLPAAGANAALPGLMQLVERSVVCLWRLFEVVRHSMRENLCGGSTRYKFGGQSVHTRGDRGMFS